MEENKIIQFLSKHWSSLLLGFLALACAGAWADRFMRKNQYKAKQDYLIANQIFERFHRGEPLTIEATGVTEEILERHPELSPKYNSLLATSYLFQGKREMALKYAQSTLSHVEDDLSPHYKTYAYTSLLITEGKIAEAFAAAQDLDVKLENLAGHATLHALNLLRLVFLSHELNQPSFVYTEKLQAHPLYSQLDSIFTEGNLTLTSYLATLKDKD